MSFDPLSDEAFHKAIDYSRDQSAADRHLNVRFYMDELKDEAASAKERRPIYKSEEFCEIRTGDKNSVVVERVRFMHPDPRERFPVQYARFKAGEAQQVVGTPLREWGRIDRSTARAYADLGVITVEQLAAVSDQNAKQVRGMLADRKTAQDYLEEMKGQAPLAEARAENEKLRDEMRALRDQVEALMASSPAPAATNGGAEPKRRGRPPGSKNKPKDDAPEA